MLTCTPYFEKRNIHFYVNKCGFYIVEYQCKYAHTVEAHKDFIGDGGDGMKHTFHWCFLSKFKARARLPLIFDVCVTTRFKALRHFSYEGPNHLVSLNTIIVPAVPVPYL